MKASISYPGFQRLRAAPLWKLLAAANAPAIIAILAEHLYEADHGMRASEFYARVDRSLEELRATGVDMPSTAREYASQWLAQGLLERTLPYGSDEEVYSLTSASADAVRFVTGMGRPRAEATESRLPCDHRARRTRGGHRRGRRTPRASSHRGAEPHPPRA
ncbi:MAG: DUF3375 family protein [Sutterella wadsworthensis]